MAFRDPIHLSFSIHDVILLPDSGIGKVSHRVTTIAEIAAAFETHKCWISAAPVVHGGVYHRLLFRNGE